MRSNPAISRLTPQPTSPPGPPLQLRGYAARGEGGAGKSLFSGSPSPRSEAELERGLGGEVARLLY